MVAKSAAGISPPDTSSGPSASPEPPLDAQCTDTACTLSYPPVVFIPPAEPEVVEAPIFDALVFVPHEGETATLSMTTMHVSSRRKTRTNRSRTNCRYSLRAQHDSRRPVLPYAAR